MKVCFSIDYSTQWGQILYVCGSTPELGNWDKLRAIPMKYISESRWEIELKIKIDYPVYYKYFVMEGDNILREEFDYHSLTNIPIQHNCKIYDVWHNVPEHKYLYSSAFTKCFFKHQQPLTTSEYFHNTLVLKAKCPYVTQEQSLIITGENDYLGNWDINRALFFSTYGAGEWQITLDATKFFSDTEYKLAIYDNSQQKVIHWHEGDNGILKSYDFDNYAIQIITYIYRHTEINWRGSGVAIPVFSLRTKDSFGIGDFLDLRKMVDWAKSINLKVIQILPINDTTSTWTWKDSYPYNAISIYALHPIYLGLKEYPLKNKQKYKEYLERIDSLNSLENIEYEKVRIYKEEYLKDLFEEIGENVLNEPGYQTFYHQNEEWLYPYAFFCYLRDEYDSFELDKWGKFAIYNKSSLDLLISNPQIRHSIQFVYFTQYLLHKQLSEVKEYANSNDIILKGDIPIGISRNSVEAWIEPHLFNLDTQTGAPPDDFALEGQNWGFPTYNWGEMEKEGYLWWIKRFQKMADYFDAYRIDHILGFFRIWEIPEDAVQGLLGYFNPARPFSLDELMNAGFDFDEYRMVKPYIHEIFLHDIFGEYTREVIDTYIHLIGEGIYELNDEFNTQLKIKEHFEGKNDGISEYIMNGLYLLCANVLFVKDKYNPHLLHPRIAVQNCYTYKHLDDKNRNIFDNLYNDFFYHRHSDFWYNNAMKKLPTLISSTEMLTCGEDLGMIPDCVHPAMAELQILTLEIERMPKEPYRLFSQLPNLPYLSVCTTSTHDMSPIRAWWHENSKVTQQYYNEVLWKNGDAPKECTSDLCWQILINHLNSPSILAILPLQDWLSINDNYKKLNPETERINVPAISDYHWQYRMHLNIEDLIEASDLNNEIKNMINISRRS